MDDGGAGSAGSAANILRAATELFGEAGFESMSVAAIATRAGVSKANVFHHFASKEGLYLAVIRELSREHAELAESIASEPGSCADKLRRLFRAELGLMFDGECRTRLLLRSLETACGKAKHMARQALHRNFVAVYALLEDGRRRGEFRKDFDAAAATLSLIAAKNLYFQSHDVLGQVEETKHLMDMNRYAEQICDVMLRGLQASAEAPR